MKDYTQECLSDLAAQVGGDRLAESDLRSSHCGSCKNRDCAFSRGRGSGSHWRGRMDTQVDRLLDNPQFADEDDPQFDKIRNMKFQSLLQESIKVESAHRKGDWIAPEGISTFERMQRQRRAIDQQKETDRVEATEPASDPVEEPVKEDPPPSDVQAEEPRKPEAEKEEGPPPPNQLRFKPPPPPTGRPPEDSQAVSSKYQRPRMKQDPNNMPRGGNNGQGDGIMIGGGPPPPPKSAPSKYQRKKKPLVDKWDPRSRDRVVKPGATVTLGRRRKK